MSKKDKLDLKTPDTFHTTSDKIFLFIEEHAKTVILSVVGVVVVSLAYIGFSYLNSRKELKAAEAIYAPEDALRKAQVKVPEDKAKEAGKVASPGDKKKAPAPTSTATKSFAEDYGPLVEKVEAAIKEYSSTRVALVTAMSLSQFLLQEKQAAKALDVLNLASYRPGKSDILAGFLHMHRGLALIETGKYQDASAEYQAIVDAKGLNALHAEALLKLALSQDLAGKSSEARASYERVAREFGGTEASEAARQALRLLELKGKKG